MLWALQKPLTISSRAFIVITDHNSFLFCRILSEKCKNTIHSVKIGGKLNYLLRKVAFMILWKVGESASVCTQMHFSIYFSVGNEKQKINLYSGIFWNWVFFVSVSSIWILFCYKYNYQTVMHRSTHSLCFFFSIQSRGNRGEEILPQWKLAFTGFKKYFCSHRVLTTQKHSWVLWQVFSLQLFLHYPSYPFLQQGPKYQKEEDGIWS